MKSLPRPSLAPVALAAALLVPSAAFAAQERGDDGRSITVRADRIYTATGTVIEGGFVSIVDGRIAAIGPGAPRGAGDDVLHVAAITPGLVDLSPDLHLSSGSVEQSDEVTPNVRITDALDPYANGFARALRSGVTTVLCAPPDENVIGGLAVALKTGGAPTVAGRTVKPDVVLRGAFGSQPSRRNSPAFLRPRDFYNRRPTTRMGVEWVWRKTFYDAVVARQEPERAIEGVDVLHAVLDGELPLMVHASATQDVRTAIFLKEEFEIPRMILDQAAEAWKEPELVQRSGVAIVLPPFSWSGRVGIDRGFHAWNSAVLLEELGVTFTFSGRDGTEADERLSVQPGYAMRGGLSFESALRAVTVTPATLLGIQDRVGTLEVGKDGDLALWSGTPFDFTSAVIGVVLDGELVVDPASRP